MATYNGEKFINQQIDSILKQSYKDFELIICDDCSKDKTVEIIKKYSDSRIKLYINEQNLGFKKNFQKAIEFCSGEFLAFCDQDDIWTENHLELLLNNISNKDLICGNAKLIDQDGNSMNVTTKECLGNFNFEANNIVLFEKLLHGNFVQGTAALITKEFSKKLFPVPESVDFHDWWAASLSTLNNGCSYLDDIVLFYRQHGNNVTTNKKITFFDSIKTVIKNRNKKIDEYRKKSEFCSALLPFCTSDNHKKIVTEAYNYYFDLSNKKYCKCIKYFNKNYQNIFWVRKPSKKLFLLRFCKIFIFHI